MTIRNLYRVHSTAKEFRGFKNADIDLFMVGRDRPIAPYADLIIGYAGMATNERPYAEDLLNDLFTEDEARALLAWLNEHRDGIHVLKSGPVPIKSREGDAPYRSGASHALSTQVLDDNNEAERALGIAAGLAWSAKADAVVVYTDHGVSADVQLGIDRPVREGRPVEYRHLEDKT